ncbi:SWIM zinc finger family protein [Nonomuraea sp. NPDC049309]|uniref:SWIM zinc finger family protein n=1 Tax=Nonomuraea sp. NPDC049309 TaxID=3364350 RepID=UPI00371FCF8E
MIERWSRDQVLTLAPDASSRKAAQGVAVPAKWPVRGHTGMVVYGECKGSGARPYLACVDLSAPAYRCSCPSRKFPCKHALGLLLLWSEEAVPVQEAAPQWVTEWLDARAARREAAVTKAADGQAAASDTAGMSTIASDSAEGRSTASETPEWRPACATPAGRTASATAEGETASGTPTGKTTSAGSEGRTAFETPAGRTGFGTPEGSQRTETSTTVGSTSAMPAGDGEARSASRGGSAGKGEAGSSGRGGSRGSAAESVRHGRVAAGLAELERWLADQVRQGLAVAAEHDWEGLAKRLIDAQAPGVAGMVSRLPRVRAEEGWPERLLEEYALLNLLAVAYRRRAELPPDLARTVLIRVGFPVTKEEVLAGPVVRDVWHVLGRRDEMQDRLTARRVWLRGRHTGRAALILSFAPQGQPLDASLVTGTAIDADLAYYPGAAPLRALVAKRYAVAAPRPATGTVRATAPGPAGTGSTPPAPAAEGAGAVPPGSAGTAGSAPLAPTAAGTVVSPGSAVAGTESVSSGSAVGAGSVSFGPTLAEAGSVPPGMTVAEALDEITRVLAEDPWTESWPLVLRDVIPDRRSLGGLPLHPRSIEPWRLIAVSGGHPLTVAAEWTPVGLRPLTTWDEEGTTVIL